MLRVLREHYGATVIREETLEGRDQYVLLLVPEGEDLLPQGQDVLPPGAKIHLWVDKETNQVTGIAFFVESASGDEAPPMKPPGPPTVEPGLGITVKEGTTYASLLEGLSERHDVTVTSEETVDGAVHCVLSLVPKADQEGLSLATGEVWVDVESGKVTRMSFASGGGSVGFEFGPAQ